jgi:hypothetical protein
VEVALNGESNRQNVRLYQSPKKGPRTKDDDELEEALGDGAKQMPKILPWGIALISQIAGAKEQSHWLAVDFSAVGVILVLRFLVVRSDAQFQAGA